MMSQLLFRLFVVGFMALLVGACAPPEEARAHGGVLFQQRVFVAAPQAVIVERKSFARQAFVVEQPAFVVRERRLSARAVDRVLYGRRAVIVEQRPLRRGLYRQRVIRGW